VIARLFRFRWFVTGSGRWFLIRLVGWPVRWFLVRLLRGDVENSFVVLSEPLTAQCRAGRRGIIVTNSIGRSVWYTVDRRSVGLFGYAT
jgi:hypothetical protein